MKNFYDKPYKYWPVRKQLGAVLLGTGFSTFFLFPFSESGMVWIFIVVCFLLGTVLLDD